MDIDEDWEEWKPESGLSFLRHSFAGSLAGVAEHVGLFPLDTLRTHRQVARGAVRPPGFFDLLRQRGFFGMWRGSRAVVMACIPSHAMYFTVYEASKERLGANASGHTPLAAAASGALATVLHDAVLTPIDVVKQRLQLGYYKGALDCMRSMLREEGAMAFMRSYPTTVAMNIPYAATVVATNESLKEVLNPHRDHDMLAYLLSGAGAGALAAFVTNPLDVIKSRLQTQRCRPSFTTLADARLRSVAPSSASLSRSLAPSVATANFYTSAEVEYTGFLHAMTKIYAQEGLPAFFKGIRARVMQHTPAMAISWSTYEFVKKLVS